MRKMKIRRRNMGKTTEQMRKKVRKARPLKKAEKNLRKKAKTLEKAAEIPMKKMKRKARKALKKQEKMAEKIQKKTMTMTGKAQNRAKTMEMEMISTNTKKSTAVRQVSRWSARILMILPILILIHRKAETTATERAAEAESRTETIRSSQMRKEPQEKTTRPEKA